MGSDFNPRTESSKMSQLLFCTVLLAAAALSVNYVNNKGGGEHADRVPLTPLSSFDILEPSPEATVTARSDRTIPDARTQTW